MAASFVEPNDIEHLAMKLLVEVKAYATKAELTIPSTIVLGVNILDVLTCEKGRSHWGCTKPESQSS
jgi:hypothetical protein